MDEMWHIVVQIWKSNAIFRAYRLSDDYFVDVIEFIPIVIAKICLN